MGSINGGWFIAVGAAVAFISSFSEELRVFIIVGIAFILYGLAKVGINKLFGSKKKEHKTSNNSLHPNIPHQNNINQNIHQHQKPHVMPHNPNQQMHPKQIHPQAQHPNMHQNTNQGYGIFCKKCGKRAGIHDNFCSFCGLRLK